MREMGLDSNLAGPEQERGMCFFKVGWGTQKGDESDYTQLYRDYFMSQFFSWIFLLVMKNLEETKPKEDP